MELRKNEGKKEVLDIYSIEGRRKLEAHAMLASIPLETAEQWIEEHNAEVRKARGELTREERIAQMDPTLRQILRDNDLI